MKRTLKISYRDTIKHFFMMIIACMIMVLILTGCSYLIPLTGHSRMMSLLIVFLYALIGAIIYFGFTYFTKTLDAAIGKEAIREVFHKKNNRE